MFTTLSLDEVQKWRVTGFHGGRKVTFLKEQMYVKQGLKREETIENGHSQKALEYPLSTDVCAILKFVTRPKITLFRLKMLKRLWKGIGGPGKTTDG